MVDSQGPEERGTFFATPGRPEIRSALDGSPLSQIRDSQDLSEDIMATAVPIPDESQDRRRRPGHQERSARERPCSERHPGSARDRRRGAVRRPAAGVRSGEIVLATLVGLAGAARRLGSGDLSARAQDVGGATEIEDLGRSFDEMAGRLERTVRAQREFVANASHQLRTPLTGMKLRIESRHRRDRGRGRQATARRRRTRGRSAVRDRRPATRDLPERSRRASRRTSISETPSLERSRDGASARSAWRAP